MNKIIVMLAVAGAVGQPCREDGDERPRDECAGQLDQLVHSRRLTVRGPGVWLVAYLTHNAHGPVAGPLRAEGYGAG